MNQVGPCAICGATPQVFFDGANYRVVHNVPCADRGNYTVEQWFSLREATITLKQEEYEIILDSKGDEVAPESIEKVDLVEATDGSV